MNLCMSRRCFLQVSATIGTSLTIVPAGAVRAYAANERLNIALIGVGGRGRWFVDTIPSMENVVALCDVDDEKLNGTFRQWEENAQRYANSEHPWERNRAAEYQRLVRSRPKTYNDFRKMLDEYGNRIDAVVIATPDHTHAVASAAAMRAGKHVFCEKPLTRTVDESRALRKLARQFKVATQMGNQGMASGEFRRTVELIWTGKLGDIHEAHVWNSGGGSGPRQPPEQSQPVPEGFHWDLWHGAQCDHGPTARREVRRH